MVPKVFNFLTQQMSICFIFLIHQVSPVYIDDFLPMSLRKKHMQQLGKQLPNTATEEKLKGT